MSLEKLIRCHRNLLLSECDWTQSPDSPLESHPRALWMEYRQTLRDLPSVQNVDELVTFDQVNWPAKPE